MAIICALEFELSAVRYLLDREHLTRQGPPGDANMYVLGELSGHNVVLTCLPGSQGKGAAAVVATNLARTFSSIKWRLLVGIGGGVPSKKHDIRLGDVVISMPDGQHGGVIQYDLGKDTEDSFHLKGFLCPPASGLRMAVQMMRSNHVVRDNKIADFLTEMWQKWPKLAKTYGRPLPADDILYDIDYPHPQDKPTCAECDRGKAAKREPRESSEIHYGLIASGDRVIKAATKRQAQVQQHGDILCFEMEAAGIATEFQCIVLRGISDYADSHKNDDWHYFAAAAAAACAKELLSLVDSESHEEHVPTGGRGQYGERIPGQQSIQNTGSGTISIGGSNTVVGGDFIAYR